MALVAGITLAACAGLPGGSLHVTTTPDLVNGALASLLSATSFEETGAFSEGNDNYSFDIQFTPPSTIHAAVQRNTVQFELIQIGGKVYYRSTDLVGLVLASGQTDLGLSHAIGNRWFLSKSASTYNLETQLIDLESIKADFFNTLTLKREDNITSGGVKVAELSTADYAMDISESSPHKVLSIRTAPGQAVYSDFVNVDIAFTNYNQAFDTVAPTGVFDIDDPTTWPPLYSVVSVDASGCQHPCVARARLENKGGIVGGKKPSTVTFTITSSTGSKALGTCQAVVAPDVANGQTVTARCTISSSAWNNFYGYYIIRAVPDNPNYD